MTQPRLFERRLTVARNLCKAAGWQHGQLAFETMLYLGDRIAVTYDTAAVEAMLAKLPPGLVAAAKQMILDLYAQEDPGLMRISLPKDR